MTFYSSGNLVSPTINISNITFAGLTDGAAAMNMTWDILGSSSKPTISQVDATSSVSGSTQNRYAAGAYQGFSIGADGTVTACYPNGQTQAVGPFALGNVTNLDSLDSRGNCLYALTLACGTVTIGTSGTDGLAKNQGSASQLSSQT
jgi:flagellar hook protein FlgE